VCWFNVAKYSTFGSGFSFELKGFEEEEEEVED